MLYQLSVSLNNVYSIWELPELNDFLMIVMAYMILNFTKSILQQNFKSFDR